MAAFPITAVLDSFTRTENPLSDGGAWATTSPFGTGRVFKTNGSVAQSADSTDGQWVLQCWNTQLTRPVETYVTITSFVASHTYMVCWLTSPTSATGSGYYIEFTATTWTVYRVDSGTATSIASGSVTVASGHSIGASMSAAGLITVYHNDGTDGWTSVGTVTDSTYVGGGYIGMSTNSASATLDSFGGGSYTPPATSMVVMTWNGTAWVQASGPVTIWNGPTQPTSAAPGDIWNRTSS
jgi:hypothetical protein